MMLKYDKKSNYNYLYKIIIILIVILIGLLFYTEFDFVKYLLVIVILLQIYLLYYFRKNNIIFIFMSFLIMYYIPLIYGYFFNYKLTPYSVNSLEVSDKKVVLIYCIFFLSMFFIIVRAKCNLKINFMSSIESYDNNNIFILSLIMICVFIVLGHNTAVNFGTYSKGSTIFNEYIIIWFFFSLIYSKNSKNKKCIVLFFYLVYSFINFTYGDRIAVLQVGILIFALNFNYKVNYKMIIIFILSVYFIFGFIDYLRGNSVQISANRPVIDNVINNNQTQVFNSSVTIVRLIDDSIVNLNDRINSFFQYIARIIVSKSRLSYLSDLTNYSLLYYPNLGGGFFAVFWYFWFDWIGVLVSGIIVGLLFVSISENKKSNFMTYLLLFISLIPRWIAYDPIQIIKIPIFTTILYIIFQNYSKSTGSQISSAR